jgi:hypothetical protein
MNERIKELAEQAVYYDEDEESWEFDRKKFAELIVRECIELNRQELSFGAFARMLDKYEDHFGIEK